MKSRLKNQSKLCALSPWSFLVFFMNSLKLIILKPQRGTRNDEQLNQH